jgi:hypothetical protein
LTEFTFQVAIRTASTVAAEVRWPIREDEAMSRHVAHVESRGLPTPRRIRRQRRLIDALSERYRPLTEDAGGIPTSFLRPARSFGFSTRTPPEEAAAKLAALLDDIDPTWRSCVKVKDGPVRG